MKLIQIQAVNNINFGTTLYGLDDSGQVWMKPPKECWHQVSMETEMCPSCHQIERKRYKRADGHGGLAVYCEDPFHSWRGRA